MAVARTFTIDQFAEKLRSLGEDVRGKALANSALAGAKVISNAARENIKEQGLIRTRTLSRSLTEQVIEQSADYVEVEVGTNLEYAAIHEYGGTIRPKSSKYLAIPVGSYTGSPSKHGDLKLRKTANGNLVMVDASGSVQYVLKSSVTIPARPYLRPAVDENQEEIIETVAKSLEILIEGSFEGAA